ncbi:hypothetical protein [Enterococcus faecalis]|nr:hypothetical protein [Enterococcus faecalis]MCO5542319.1 hypothetical protein [Enterococcus faecalis]
MWFVVEDLEGADVNKYKYEVNYMLESIIPWNIVQKKYLDKKEKLPNWG